MRKLLLLMIGILMIVGGSYLLVAEVLWSDKIYSALVLGAAMLVVLGAYLILIDFIAPLLGITTGEE